MKHRRSWVAVALCGLLACGCGGGGETEEISEGTPSEFGDAPIASSTPEAEAAPAGDAPAPPPPLAAGPTAEAPPPPAPTTPPAAEATASSDAPAGDSSGTLAMLQAANTSAPAPDQAGNSSGQPDLGSSSGQPGPAGYPAPGSSGGQMAGQGAGGPQGYPMPGGSGGPQGYPMPGGSGDQSAYQNAARAAGSGGMRPDSAQGPGPGGPNGYPMPGANGMPGMAPGGPGSGRGDSAMAGMMPGYGGSTGGKPDYSQPVKTVESFLNAVRNRDLAMLSEATSARAGSDSATKTMQEFFNTIIERSLDANQLGELATELSNYKVVRALPPKSTGRFEVMIGKEGKDDRDRKVYFSRKITVRKEKSLWKVLDMTKASKSPRNF